jgi:hypothetical protein
VFIRVGPCPGRLRTVYNLDTALRETIPLAPGTIDHRELFLNNVTLRVDIDAHAGLRVITFTNNVTINSWLQARSLL